MNVVVKQEELEINGEKFIMRFDMKSIPVFKQMTGKSFLQSVAKIGSFEDDAILGFLAATLRPINNPDQPIGGKIREFNILELLVRYNGKVIDLITSGMPQSDRKSKKK